MSDQHRTRMIIAELVHLRGELAFLLVALQKKGVLSAEEFQKDFEQFWQGQGPELASRYVEQFEAQWAKEDGQSQA